MQFGSPQDPSAAQVADYKRRAATLLQTGEPMVAVDLLEEVLPKARKDPELAYLLGIAHRLANNPGESIRHLTRATRLNGGNIDAWCLLSDVYAEAGQLRKSHQALDSVFAFAPDNPKATSIKARLFESHGRAQQAYDLLAKHRGLAAENDVSIEAVFCGICLNLGHHAEGIDAARGVLGRVDLPPQSRQPMLTLLGHLLDATGDYDDAFEAYHRASVMGDAAEPLDPGQVKQFWSPELLARIEPLQTRSDLPALIVGMPRSGTTLTDQIITSHPRAGGVGESSFLVDAIFGLSPDAITPQWCAQTRSAYLDMLRRGAGEKPARITDKMPENYLLLGLVSRALPGARVIHCTRDARDVALSCFFQNFGPARLKWSRRLESCARQYLAYTEVMRYWAGVLDEPPVLESAYAELTGEPEASVRTMLDHLGLGYDPACLEFHRSKRSVTTASVAQVRRPLYQTSRNRWKNYEKHIGVMLDLLKDV